MISLDQSNNCVVSKDDEIFIVSNILEKNGHVFLVVQKFQTVLDFYNVGVMSSSLGIWKCSNLSLEIKIVNINCIRAKCFRMPFWDARYANAVGIVPLDFSADCDDNDEDWYSRGEPVKDVFIFIELF